MPQVGLVLVAGAAVAALGLGWFRVEPAKARPASQPASVVPVQTAIVQPNSVELARSGLGTVVAWNTATITPQVSGQLVVLPFQDGSLVQQGEVLARIDPRPSQAALDFGQIVEPIGHRHGGL
jgi:membrane fusion protein, multidrug efflux system